MKKFIMVLVGAAAIALLQSCAGSQKHCAAYAKHEAGNQPSYHQTQ